MKRLTQNAAARIVAEIAAAHGQRAGIIGLDCPELDLLEERANAGESTTVELRGMRDPQGYTVHVTASAEDFEEVDV